MTPVLRLVSPPCPFPSVHTGECLTSSCRYWGRACTLAEIHRRGPMLPEEIAQSLGVARRLVEWDLWRVTHRPRVRRLLRGLEGAEMAKGVHALAVAQQEGEEVAND